MGREIFSRIKKFLSYTASGATTTSPKSRDDVDVREEYANAFRTESYNQFWTRVTQLSHKKSATCSPIESSSTSARLMSYRLFAQNLLDPDPITVTRILYLTRTRRLTRFLLSSYYSETANAFLICSILLRSVDRIRSKYESLKTQIEFKADPLDLINQFMELSKWFRPFVSSGFRIRVVQNNCSNLLNRLESSRDKTRTKLRFINGLRHGSGMFVVALTTTLIVTIASHAFALFIAGPSLLTARFKPAGLTKKLMRTAAQLDIAAKGTYILSRDLDTISRLVSRFNDEVEHARAVAEFWAVRGLDRVRAKEEVARQMKMTGESLSEQLDELEEHLHLCFMTINRARNLVVREILDPGRPGCSLGPKSK
ncbi:PREDICTED: UPF0496 protein At3g49070 [Tarenaya hassleriana]|uniref:UPF0496 protein At3g49070 n=1 Tax=Tarenaya hassleriana TaxID=28532 RepID=UPI00053C53BB|nr:PREDICTED: UPF0496 protein At3g49070 [Tarenaya hassleriana]